MKFGSLIPPARFVLRNTDLSIYSSMPAFIKLGEKVIASKGSTQVFTLDNGMPFYGITDDTDVVEIAT